MCNHILFQIFPGYRTFHQRKRKAKSYEGFLLVIFPLIVVWWSGVG